MKLFVLVAAFAIVNAAKLDKTYLPPHSSSSGGGNSLLQTPFLISGSQSFNGQNVNSFAKSSNVYSQNNGFGNEYNHVSNNFGPSRAERPRAALERNAAIVRQDSSNENGAYSYAYETENGIYAEENGVATDGVEAQGGFSYTDDDGTLYSVRYTAGQNGFEAQGDHLPTPPPVPEEILRALEQNARDEAAGIYDDGSYNEVKYGAEERRTSGYQYEAAKSTNFGSISTDDAVITNSAALTGFNTPKAFATPANSLRTQATFGGNLQKAYLPPLKTQRGFASGRQTFSSRNGYQY